MNIPLHRRVVGYRVVSVAPAYAAPLLEICRRYSLPYGSLEVAEDGRVFLCLSLYTAARLEEICAGGGIPLATHRRGGLPLLLIRFLHRPGLLVGGMVGIFLLVAASRVVWDIRITGNETIPDCAIRETLAASGFSVGTTLDGLEVDEIENQALLRDHRLAWISINRRGTVAYVEVREAIKTPKPEPDTPADIVASRGGIIQRVELEAGNVRVFAGQVVGEGDVLVSGLWDSDRVGIRTTRAKARVFAKTEREMVVSIPLTYTQKVYATGEDGALPGNDRQNRLNCEKSLIFFGKTIKFSKKTGNVGGVCDTIETEKVLSPIPGVGFPLSVRTVWYLPYAETTATRTYAQAEELAYLELSRQIAAIPGGAEILQKTVTTHHTPDALVLHCTLSCIEDIGATREIQVGE